MPRLSRSILLLLLFSLLVVFGCQPKANLNSPEFQPDWNRIDKSLIEYSLALVPLQVSEHPVDKTRSFLALADALVQNGEVERGRAILESLWPSLEASALPNAGAPKAYAALIMERTGDNELGMKWAHHIQQPGNLANYLRRTENPLDKTDLHERLLASLNPEKGPELLLRSLIAAAELRAGKVEMAVQVADDGERLYREKPIPAFPFESLLKLATLRAEAGQLQLAHEVLREALKSLDKLSKIRQDQLCDAGKLAATIGQPELAKTCLEQAQQLVDRSQANQTNSRLGAGYALLGDLDSALKWTAKGKFQDLALAPILENVNDSAQLDQVTVIFERVGPGRLGSAIIWKQALDVAGELEQPETTQKLLKLWLQPYVENGLEPDAYDLATLAIPLATYRIEPDEEVQDLLKQLASLNPGIKKGGRLDSTSR
jgi:hypothetical protein